MVLLGNGISNIRCLDCSPPPEPECHLDGTSSIEFVANYGTDCDSEDGTCSYTQIETLCAPDVRPRNGPLPRPSAHCF